MRGFAVSTSAGRSALVLLQMIVGAPLYAQSAPLDLWTPVLQKIRNPHTLRLQIIPRAGYFEVFYDSEIRDAKWADSEPPYAVHVRDTVRIHAYLAAPASGGPYPALVVGHGHGGSGSPELAVALAALGYVALSIDGPQSGQSTGGPRDTEQAWISVEQVINQPSPEVGYLYHYAYAGMRGLTVLEALSRLPANPFRIDRDKLGVAGASMGGQFTYYINGVDDRVKAAVAIAVAGDWQHILSYEGAWLYHGVYYYTRDGLRSGVDHLNTIADVCRDPTMKTFLDYFDPIGYAPSQHGPLLTIVGTHDQYFAMPAINETFDRVESAGSSPRFIKRIVLTPNGKHGVVDSDNPLSAVLSLLPTIDEWLKYSFHNGSLPPQTPTVTQTAAGDWLVFRASAAPGDSAIQGVNLYFATELDSTRPVACDFRGIRLLPFGNEYVGFLPKGLPLVCGPPISADNLLYYVAATDSAGYTISSKMYYRSGEMRFGSGFVPRIEHWRGDDFPVPPPPAACSPSASH
jgi:cephalosporin-C deacetylase-like acetyl esterase